MQGRGKTEIKPKRKLTAKQKRRIEKELLLLRADISAVLNRDVEPVNCSGDYGDVGESERVSTLDIHERNRNHKKLHLIDEALESLNDGTYGVCRSCSEPIEVNRLEVRPMTVLCIDCKNAEEEEAKRYARRGYYPLPTT